ncbi:MAG: lamin tail domain-containing protein, partial [Planctomycetes bacterium]|nr:lamin tail domain-containing protein [Planctomycetota bacterium]
VQISDGAVTSTTGTYDRQTGSLRVAITPPAVVTGGAQWRVDGGAWQSSVATVSSLTTGSHTVEFKDITDWTKPGSEAVQINDGVLTDISRAYVQQVGSLQVNISPSEVVTAGAQWSVDGGGWQNSGATVSSLPVGSHTIDYKDVTGWTKPADEIVQISDSALTTTTGTYVRQTGSLQVFIEPEAAQDDGAFWRVDGGDWHSSGHTQSALAAGAHTVEFLEIPNWYTPGNQQVQVSIGSMTQATGSYSRHTGSLRVTITPPEVISEGAQWRVDDGAWQASGTTVTSLEVGMHSVEFLDVAGWQNPPSKEAEIFVDTLATINGDYIEIIPVTLQINELMASNNSSSGISDPQGEFDDWFEIYNSTASPVDIGGMYVADDGTIWQIPTGYSAQTTIGPNDYLVLWADNDTLDGPLHVGFKLGADGDSLTILDVDGLTVVDSVIIEDQVSNISYGRYLDGSSTFFYFATASPGYTNNGEDTFDGQVADTEFNHDRGFYYAPIDVTIATDTPGATVYYTTDGTDPLNPDGTPTATAAVYATQIPVVTTTSLRAAAVKTLYLPSNIDTQTYIFLDHVLLQDGSGLPAYSNWGDSGPDWEMDPEVIDDELFTDDDGLSFDVADALLAAPTLSLVMDWNDWFGGGGIYISGEGDERICSAELISPDSSEEGFQVNCTVQIVGGSSTSRWKMDKLSMRLKFRQQLDDGTPTGGPGKLSYDLFPDSQVNQFDTVVLDARMNMTWAYGGSVKVNIDSSTSDDLQNPYAQYTRDQFPSDIQNTMGGLAPHGRPVHLYLNGVHWGLYFVHERPDGAFAASYLDGEKEDYDVLKHDPGFDWVVGFDDDLVAKQNAADNYDALSAAANQDLSSATNYNAILDLIDVDALADYMIMNFYIGNTDWAHHNWYVTRNRETATGLWRYHSWDPEHCMKWVEQNVVTKDDGDGSPTDLHRDLRSNDDYKLLFADHVHRHFFNNGVLTPTGVADLYQYRLDLLDRAVVAESVRWGDNQRSTPYTRDAEWITERNRMWNEYFPQRTGFVLDDIKNDGMYPNTQAPVFGINSSYQHGGAVSIGDNLSMDNPNGSGTIWYTLDGSDPRPLVGSRGTLSARVPTTSPSPSSAGPLAASSGTIIWVSDDKMTGGPADQGWVDLLVSHGYTVDLSFRNWDGASLGASEIATMNAADLIIISRDTNSGSYTAGAPEWNSITTPIILTAAHIVRNNRWEWLDTSQTNDSQPTLEAVDPAHEVFSGVTLNGSNQVSILTTVVSFASTTVAGNGTIVARRADNNQVWIVTWEAGQTFYSGSDYAPVGPRMYFAAGGTDPDGEYNLTAAGETIFLNAVSWYIDPTANHAPAVNAGVDQSILWPEDTATMDATVSDDGLPEPPSLTLTWSKLSGPGSAAFSPNVNAEDPTVTFSEPGTYELQLDAFDGEKHGADTVLISVTDMSGAMVYVGPITLNYTVRVKSRVLNDSGEWSALNEAVYGTGPIVENLRITELMYHPQDTGNPDDPNEEFIELTNIGPETINLNLARFTNGIDFTFGDVELAAGEYVLVVRSAAAFAAQYPGFSGVIAGEYAGSLDNAGERIELEDALGQSILNFSYKDGWRSITDGQGFSLTIIDPADSDPNNWDEQDSWRASAYIGGSPGYDDSGIIPNPGDVVINEILAHSHDTEADWIELYNTTDSQIDIGGWYLSDSDDDLQKYQFAIGTKIDAHDYLVLYEDPNFGDSGSDSGSITGFAFSENGDQAYLSSAEADVLTGYREVEDFGASYTG